MLIRTSGAPQPNLYLLTLGNTCRYAVGLERLTLTDPGAGAHAAPLEARLQSLKIPLSSIERVVLTNLRGDRIGALPALRARAPHICLTLTATQALAIRSTEYQHRLYAECLALEKLTNSSPPPPPFNDFVHAITPDEIIPDSEVIECSGGLALRVSALPGHTAESVGFFVEPYGFLIADEVLGYYRGRELAAPGCDASIEASLSSLKKVDQLPLHGLGLSNMGVLTGELVRKHLYAVTLNTQDLKREVSKARSEGVPPEVITRSIRDSFYTSDSRDPFVLDRLERTFRSIVTQCGLVS